MSYLGRSNRILLCNQACKCIPRNKNALPKCIKVCLHIYRLGDYSSCEKETKIN
nr:hypothetical protein P-5 - Chlamydia trachomatis plasmid pLGV440 [Chlamydia trachomatis]